MTVSLVVLCGAALALLCFTTSVVVRAALPLFDQVAIRLRPRARARVWLALIALPLLVGGLSLFVTFLPAMGVGVDHCLSHDPHHLHLCPDHLTQRPSLLVTALFVVITSRVLQALVGLVRATWLSHTTARALVGGSSHRGDLFVFQGRAPRAFVVGLGKPLVFASRGLLALGENVSDAVLAHERAHAHARDPFWRAVAVALGRFHDPWIGRLLLSRLVSAQEMAADADAAREVGDRLRVAEALLVMARQTRPVGLTPAAGLGFSEGDLAERVRALCAEETQASRLVVLPLFLGGAILVALVGLQHEIVHHGLETLLGALS